jgi:SAM-dependent methyltransferase
MGRRGIGVEEEGRWIFNRLADDYRERPGYPVATLDRLAAMAGAGPAVDVGAGTGLVSLPLAARGIRIRAVEPARAMLDVLSAGAAGLPVETVQAAAEDTGLPGGEATLVVLADALQWVDPEAAGAEAGRLLAPGGAVAVVEAQLGGSPFADGVAALLAEANPHARPRPPGRLSQFLRAAGVPARRAEAHRHEEVLSPERLDAVLRYLSLVGPALGPEGVEALLAAARDLARRTGGATWTREVRVTWGRRA